MIVMMIRVRGKVGPGFPTWGHGASFPVSPSEQPRKLV